MFRAYEELEAGIALLLLKCGAGQGWRRSVDPSVLKMKTYYKESIKTGMPYIQQKAGQTV